MKRGKKGAWYVYFRPFKTEKIGLRVDVKTKSDAEQIEGVLLRACRTWHFSGLDEVAREAAVRLFQNQGWELPEELGQNSAQLPVEEMTLWRAIKLCLQYPGVRDSSNRERHEASFVHLVRHFGKDYQVKKIWIPEIKEYQSRMLKEGVAPGTINKQKAALSKLFQVLVELRHVQENPCRLVKNLSEKSGQREAYVGFDDFCEIVDLLPAWCRPVAQVAYYTGLRRAEIVNLDRQRVNLDKRIIYLGPEHTKEGDFKRVPIHRELIPILENALEPHEFKTDRVFLIDGKPLSEDSLRKPWVTATKKVGLNPSPNLHDLRHSFVANCRRSGVSHEIVQTIVGHWNRTKKVSERYGRISDNELLQAIDSVTFNHGETEIFVAGQRKIEKGNKKATTSEIDRDGGLA